MALDWPAFGTALWRVSDETGIRPEWQLPVLSLETSGTFDPSIVNPWGCVGINQLCRSTYVNYASAPVSEYRQWSASQQLEGPVSRYWKDAQRFGPIRSATKLMLAQLGQKLHTGASLNDVVFETPSIQYRSNRRLDPEHNGVITVRDLANALTYHAQTNTVQDAIRRVYAMRPNEQPTDAIYGTDFDTEPKSSKLVIGAVLGTLTIASGYGIYRLRRGS